MKMTIKGVLQAAILGGTVGLVPQLALADVSSDEVPASQGELQPNRLAEEPGMTAGELRGSDEARSTTEELGVRATDHASVQARGAGESEALSAPGIPDHNEAENRSLETLEPQ
jgi:hypothetical protein